MINIPASVFFLIFLGFGQNFEKQIWNLKKPFQLFIELVETNPLLYITLKI